MTSKQKEQNGILLRLHTTARMKQRKEFLEALGDLENFQDDIDTEMRYILQADGARIKTFTPAGQAACFVTCVNGSTDKESLAKYERIYKEAHVGTFWDVFKTEYEMTEEEFAWVTGGL